MEENNEFKTVEQINEQEPKKKGKGFIIVLLFLFILGVGAGYICYKKVFLKLLENKKIEPESGIIKYEFKKGDIITFKDNSKWLVLEDSDKNQETVKLMGIDDYGMPCDNEQSYSCVDENTELSLIDEFFNVNTDYVGSNIEMLVNSWADKIPAKLKNVDGYKIRLLSVDDIMAFDEKWIKTDDIPTYIYIGDQINEAFLGAWLKDIVANKCEGQFEQETGQCLGNTGVFLCVGYSYDSDDSDTYEIHGGSSGVATIKPVIFAFKNSI